MDLLSWLVSPESAYAADIYFAQNQLGAHDGSTCGNAIAVSAFNGGTQTPGNTATTGTYTSAPRVISSLIAAPMGDLRTRITAACWDIKTFRRHLCDGEP